MATNYALINKEVIPHVCSNKRVSVEYLIEKTRFSLNRIEKWLDVSDTTLPTILQAKKLAKTIHIPFASLYMNVEDINIKAIPKIKNYRTLDASLVVDDSGLNIAICDVLQEREFLIETSEKLEVSVTPYIAPICSNNDSIAWAKAIRKHYSLDLKEQYRSSSSRQFYLYLREKIEAKGVFVQCFLDVPVSVARGFSIFEHCLPVIGINDEDRPPAKSFTLIHELVHLIKRESSVCNALLNDTSLLSEEVFCNSVAGELLVPRDALAVVLKNKGYNRPFSVDDISEIAKRFSVSKEVIIRRLLDCAYITDVEYKTYADEFKRIIDREREEQRLEKQEGGGRNFGRNVSWEAIDKTSPAVCKALYKGFTEEMFSKRDISQHLGIAQKHIDKFLAEVSRWSR